MDTKWFLLLASENRCGVLSLVGEVSLQILGHPEGLDGLGAEDGRHDLVGREEEHNLGVLEVVLVDVGEQALQGLHLGQLLSLRGSQDRGQLSR